MFKLVCIYNIIMSDYNFNFFKVKTIFINYSFNFFFKLRT